VKTGFYTAPTPTVQGFAPSGSSARRALGSKAGSRAGSAAGSTGVGAVWIKAVFSCALALTATTPALAVDGCKLLLCMAGNWRQIAPCEPTVRQALRDVARGRGWPQCAMGGNSDTAHEFVAPVNCPEQYRTEQVTRNDRVVYFCPFSGVVLVAVAGQPWTRTWWSPNGDTVVQWLPAAKAALADQPGAMDTRFDDDHAAWVIRERERLAALDAGNT
jgi:hypothetical protein